MTIDTTGLVPALGGGLLIGLAAGGLYLFTGRIAGVSGVAADLMTQPGRAWRWLFVAGLILAGLAARLLDIQVPDRIGSSLPLLVVAGLLVGFGTRLGNGCTSGHGVCGLSRLSLRSLVAVGVFMATAAATVFVLRHVGAGI